MAQIIDVAAVRAAMQQQKTKTLTPAQEKKAPNASSLKKPMPSFKAHKSSHTTFPIAPPAYQYTEYKRGLFDAALVGAHRVSGDGSLIARFAESPDLKHAFDDALSVGTGTTIDSPYLALALTATGIAARHQAEKLMQPEPVPG